MRKFNIGEDRNTYHLGDKVLCIKNNKNYNCIEGNVYDVEYIGKEFCKVIHQEVNIVRLNSDGKISKFSPGSFIDSLFVTEKDYIRDYKIKKILHD